MPAVDFDPLPALQPQFPSLRSRPSSDFPALQASPDTLVAVLQTLRDTQGYDMLTDVTAVDWEKTSPRFTVVYHLYATAKHQYVRVACDCPDDARPEVPSVTQLWPASNWHERETYDMFGIQFTNHPDLRRILMWDGYPYFPLRKEFPLAGIDTELPGADVAAETGARVKPAPLMGGPFVASPDGTLSESEPRAKDQSWTERTEKPV